MRNLLSQKGCGATLLHDDTWSLILPNTRELFFDNEIELCDFLEDLPDINSAEFTLHSRGYTSLRSNDSLVPAPNSPQHNPVPPINVHVNFDSRAIHGLLDVVVPEKTLPYQSDTPPEDSSSEDSSSEDSSVGDAILYFSLITLAFTVINIMDRQTLPSGMGWLFLLAESLGNVAAIAAVGLVTYFLCVSVKKRITISLVVSFIAFVISLIGRIN
jgi:hypothetical protein